MVSRQPWRRGYAVFSPLRLQQERGSNLTDGRLSTGARRVNRYRLFFFGVTRLRRRWRSGFFFASDFHSSSSRRFRAESDTPNAPLQ